MRTETDMLSETLTDDQDLRVNKLSRFSFEIPSDEKGAFRWITKGSLRVDHTYQRDFRRTKMGLIAPKWSWAACGVLIVAERKDGLYVIDGQHRLAAAMLRADIKDLPCLVFKGHSVAQEAKAFHIAQSARSPVKAIEQHRARVVFDDPDSAFLEEVIRGSGYSVIDIQRDYAFRCVGSALRCIKLDREAFRQAWPLICALHQGTCIHGEVLEGVWYLYKHTQGSIAVNPLRERLLRLTLRDALAWIGKARSYYVKGGAKVYARGLANYINQRATTYRITFNDDDG